MTTPPITTPPEPQPAPVASRWKSPAVLAGATAAAAVVMVVALVAVNGGGGGSGPGPTPAAVSTAEHTSTAASTTATTTATPTPTAMDMPAVMTALPARIKDQSTCRQSTVAAPNEPGARVICSIPAGNALIAGLFRYESLDGTVFAHISKRAQYDAKSWKQYHRDNVMEHGADVVLLDDSYRADSVAIEWVNTETFLEVKVMGLTSVQNARTFLERVGFGGAAPTSSTAARPNDFGAMISALPEPLRNAVDCRTPSRQSTSVPHFRCAPKAGNPLLSGIAEPGMSSFDAWIDTNAAATAAGWRSASAGELVADKGPLVTRISENTYGHTTYTVRSLNTDTGLMIEAAIFDTRDSARTFVTRAGLE